MVAIGNPISKNLMNLDTAPQLRKLQVNCSKLFVEYAIFVHFLRTFEHSALMPKYD